VSAADSDRVAVLLDRIEADLAELRAALTPPADSIEPSHHWLTTAQAAELFSPISDRQIRRLCARGAGQMIGANWAVDPAKLRAMLKR
jgi:hypothetical protein